MLSVFNDYLTYFIGIYTNERIKVYFETENIFCLES